MLIKHKITLKDINENFTIPIQIPQNHKFLGQSDVINEKIIKPTLLDVIDEIIDYEKFQFKPITPENNLIKKIQFNINLVSNGLIYNDWNNWGFIPIEIEKPYNNFKMSFLKISLYDTDKIHLFDEVVLYLEKEINVVNNLMIEYPSVIIREKYKNNSNEYQKSNEGFYCYFYEELLNPTYDIYARFQFNNAKDGKVYYLYKNYNEINLTNYPDMTFFKITLLKNDMGLCYYYDDDNIIYDNDNMIINLYHKK